MRPGRGRLIAVDGSGASLSVATRTLAAAVRHEREGSGVSAWDSSGIFTELAADGETGPSARTLTLLYAADLAFRIRWQIRPALDAGLSVVAAPYVETAKALAIATGLPRKWVQELFRFAPEPDNAYHAPDRLAVTRRGSSDYLECFISAVSGGGDRFDSGVVRSQSAAYLMALEKRRRCRRFRAG